MNFEKELEEIFQDPIFDMEILRKKSVITKIYGDCILTLTHLKYTNDYEIFLFIPENDGKTILKGKDKDFIREVFDLIH